VHLLFTSPLRSQHRRNDNQECAEADRQGPLRLTDSEPFQLPQQARLVLNLRDLGNGNLGVIHDNRNTCLAHTLTLIFFPLRPFPPHDMCPRSSNPPLHMPP